MFPFPHPMHCLTGLLCCGALAFTSPGQAEDDLEPIGGYGATLAAIDKVNSSGVRLNSLAAMLQQDRYNVNVRHILQSGDSTDGFFMVKANRVTIAQAEIRIDPLTKIAIRNGTPALLVDVFRQRSDGRLILSVNLSDGDPAG